MANSTACPDPAALQRYLLGHVANPEGQPLEQHLLTCPNCQATTLEVPADSLIQALAQGPTMDEIHHATEDAAIIRRLSRTPGLPPPLPLEAYHIDGYRLLRRIGSGGMGVVFEADDEQLQRRVAVKVLAAHLAAEPTACERFLREAQAAAAIQSDHVVAIHQVGFGHDGAQRPVPFIVMPLLAGESLDACFRRGQTWSLVEILRIGAEVAQGLAAAHAVGLVHRDIKPANLWIEENTGRVKILDFGLVQRRSEAAELTEEGMMIGTPAYLAPEQASGGTIDHRADLFSLGCVLYELAVGRPPFSGCNVLERLTAIAMNRPTPPQSVRPGLPRALSALILKLLQKSADRRPTSAREVEQTLRSLMPASPAARKPLRRVSVLVGLVALLVGVGLGLGLWYLLSDASPTPNPLADNTAKDNPPPQVAPVPPDVPPVQPVPVAAQGWTVVVGRVEVKDTTAGGQPWDTNLWPGDRPTPDLFVEVERVQISLRDRLRRIEDENQPLRTRKAMQSAVAQRERQLAQLNRQDPQYAQKERECREFKSRYPVLTEEEQLQHEKMNADIAGLRAHIFHTTTVVNNTVWADFNSGTVPIQLGETLHLRVWDSDGALTASQSVGKASVLVTEAMLRDGSTTLVGFEQVISLELRFKGK